jgi:hypothetical protein
VAVVARGGPQGSPAAGKPVTLDRSGCVALAPPAWLARAAGAESGSLYRCGPSRAGKNQFLQNVSQLGYTSRVAKKQRAVRIKEQDLQRLEELAKKEHETVSFLIQSAIREFLDRKESRQ